MKNKKLRNVLISAGSAVFVGVLLLGINVAVGVAPGYDPPGTGISPTFTGLGVTGNVIVGNNVNSESLLVNNNARVEGTLEIGENLNVDINLEVGGNTSIDGDMTLGVGSMFGSVYKIVSSTSGGWSYTDSCRFGDILLSCGGWNASGR